MKNVFMFDIDGTLTPHRCAMTEDMTPFFEEFCRNNKVYLVTGSDITKVKEQVPRNILRLVEGTYTCSGNALYSKELECVYEKSFYPNPKLDSFLNGILESSPWAKKTGNHIEKRPGMVNFSVVGRACTRKERAEYNEWDEKHAERKMMRDKIITQFPGLDCALGGQISLDIYPKGWDKSQAYNRVKLENPDSSILFYGDRLKQGGNDYPVYEAMIRSSDSGDPSRRIPADFAYSVESYRDTKASLERLLVGWEEHGR